MSEDRTTGSAPPDAAPQGDAADSDATHAHAVSPIEPGDTVEHRPSGGARAAEPVAGGGDVGTSRGTERAQATSEQRAATTPGAPSAGSRDVERTAAAGAPTTVLPAGGRPPRPTPPRPDRPAGEPRAARTQPRPAGRRRARLVLQRIDAWSVFLFSLVASICLGVVLFVAVAALYAALSSLGVLGSLNGLLGEVAGSGTEEQVVEPFITAGRVLGATAVLAAVDVVLLTALATLGALLYNLCASLTGGIEVQLGERE